MSETAYFFKFICQDSRRRGTGGFTSYRWPINQWTKRINGELVLCRRGYHLLRPRDLRIWMFANPRYWKAKLYLVKAETEGMVSVEQKNNTSMTKYGIHTWWVPGKVAVRRARTIRQIAFTRDDFKSKQSIAKWMERNNIKPLWETK